MQIRVTCMDGCRCILRLPLYASAPIRTTKNGNNKKNKKNGNLKRGVLGALCYHRLSRHLQEGTNYLQGYFFFDTGHVCGENVSVTQLTI